MSDRVSVWRPVKCFLCGKDVVFEAIDGGWAKLQCGCCQDKAVKLFPVYDIQTIRHTKQETPKILEVNQKTKTIKIG
jgi:hypothetical protein